MSAPRVDVVRDHVEFHDHDVKRGVSTIVFPHSTAKVPANEVELVAALTREVARAHGAL